MLKNLSVEKINNIIDDLKNMKNNSFEFIKGNHTDFIISAPHAVTHTINGEEKNPEPYTAVIAKLLNEYYGYSILCKTKNCNDDANYEENSPYKEFLCSLCEEYKPILVLDLHEINKQSETIINLGTDFGKTLQDDTEMLSEFFHAFNKYGINKIATDSPFIASLNNVAGSVSSRIKQKSIQIEINRGFLENSENNIVKIVNAIHYLCQTLRKHEVVRTRNIDVKNLRLIDEKFLASQSLNDFEYVNGLPEIVISAPHAKDSVFENKIKKSESMTGSICKTFYKEFGFSIIYKSKDNNEDYFNSKTNDYKSTLFKNVLTPKTKLFLELHILNKDRIQDVTMFLPKDYENEKLYQIINILNNHNLHYFSINSVFDSYKKARTINQIKNKCFKLQICFNQRLIEDDNKLKDVVDTLKDIISLFL